MTAPSDDALRDLLRRTRTIAVVGLSPKPARPSNSVSRYLQRAVYRIIPINPGHEHILGEQSYPTLEAAARDHAIDVVDVFRRSEHAGGVVAEALAGLPPEALPAAPALPPWAGARAALGWGPPSSR